MGVYVARGPEDDQRDDGLTTSKTGLDFERRSAYS